MCMEQWEDADKRMDLICGHSESKEDKYDYDCKKACRICPFPGAKCSQDVSNVSRSKH